MPKSASPAMVAAPNFNSSAQTATSPAQNANGQITSPQNVIAVNCSRKGNTEKEMDRA